MTVHREHPPAVRRGERWVWRDAAWWETASVALVINREEARITREVKAERFENAK